MRVLLISDIHGNLPALESVLKEAKRLGYDTVWCAGDIVGYYPWVNEVCQWVRENVEYCVLGNHDAVIAGLVNPEYFSSAAYEAIVWTMENLSEENKKFISSLPVVKDLGDTILVHDTPLRPMSMEYILYPEQALKVLQNTDRRFTIYGHTHIPVVYEYSPEGLTIYYKSQQVVLRENSRYLINPGSVGQPRDGVPLASFAIWDRDKNLLIRKRVDFDKDRVLKEVIKRGLPPELGYRLFEGY